MVSRNNEGFVGLSTDPKPTGYENGMKFLEIDTGNTYRYDAANKAWLCPSEDVASIRVKTAPTKTSYYTGDTFVATGMVIEATFKDHSTRDVTGYTVSPTTMADSTTAVTITYKGKTCTQAVTVTPLAVTSIAVKTAPTKTAYSSEDNILTMEGLVITATYNNESTADVAYGSTGLTYSPAEGSTVTESGNVTITYSAHTCTQAITYA